MGAIIVLTSCRVAPVPVEHPSSGLETLWVVDPERLSPAEQTLALTLQGLVAERSEAIWIQDGGMYALVLDDLVAEGVTTQQAGSVWDLLSTFRDAVAGMVLYDLGTDSINVATSLCGPLQAVAVDGSLQTKAEAAGLEVLADVRGMDEVAAFAEYGALFTSAAEAEGRPALLIEQAESKNAHLRDFAVARRAFTVYDLESDDHMRIATALGPDLTAFGWGPDEYAWIHQISSEGGIGLAADWSRNLSVLQRVPATLPERPHPTVRPAKEGERIVAFVMSDGDNIQWMGGQFVTAEGFWANPHRGEFAMTWEMAPLLAEVFPRALARFYAEASRGRAIDDFVVGPSGVGYAFHNYLPDRVAFARRTAAAMRATDLRVTTMLNANGGMEQSVELLAQPEIMGVIYKDWSPYNAKEGRIYWYEGKPCVSYRYILWDPLPKNSPEGVAAAIANLPASPQTDQNSYALINVHAWSFGDIGGPMEAVARTIELLPPKTRVVTAEELIVLLRENFGEPVE
ncbi:MAG: hypothetical protein MUF84_18245 [Anaerolineae bacterium]|nr:hypothetical protein [Anaerolineae bacterium]